MPPKVVKSISMDDAFYKKIARHAKRRHMSASGWLAAAAEEKLERDRIVDLVAKEAAKGRKK